MLPEKNSFDDSIKRKLQDDEEAVSGALWENITKEIPSKSSNRDYIKYLAALLLLISVTGYYFVSENNKKNIDLTLAGNMPASDNNFSASNLNSSATKPEIKKALTQETKAANHQNENDVFQAESKSSVFEKDKFKNSVPEENSNAITPGNVRPILNVTSAEPGFAEIDLLPTTYLDGIITENQLAPYVPTNDFNTNKEESQTLASNNSEKDSAIISDGLKNNAGIEVSFSPDFIFKEWSVGKNGSQEYLETRKETESFVFAHTYGTKFFFKVAKGVHIKTGMYLSEVTEILHYSYLKAEPGDLFTKLTGLSGTWYNPLTNQTVNDTTLNNFVYPDDVVSTNTYKFYNIPLQVAVYKDVKRFRIGVSAGAMLNISFRQKGSIMKDDNYGKIVLSDKNRSPYKSAIGLGLTTSTFAAYKIRKNVNFFIEPEYRIYTKDVSKKDAPLSERISTLSIMSGLQLEF